MEKVIIVLVVVTFATGCISSPSQLSNNQIKDDIIQNREVGTCEGMPGIVSEELMRDYLEEYDDTTSYVEETRGNLTLSEKYNIVEKFNQIRVYNKTDSRAMFSFEDGRCCVITSYEGIYSIEEREILSINKTGEENVPC
jgi:hypothetical protein